MEAETVPRKESLVRGFLCFIKYNSVIEFFKHKANRNICEPSSENKFLQKCFQVLILHYAIKM